jgi:hypothetical protein
MKPYPKNVGKYSELDIAILAAIGEGCTAFWHIQYRVRLKAEKVTPKDRFTGEIRPWRIVDRRLQTLRKSGVITYLRGSGWSLV